MGGKNIYLGKYHITQLIYAFTTVVDLTEI